MIKFYEHVQKLQEKGNADYKIIMKKFNAKVRDQQMTMLQEIIAIVKDMIQDM